MAINEEIRKEAEKIWNGYTFVSEKPIDTIIAGIKKGIQMKTEQLRKQVKEENVNIYDEDTERETINVYDIDIWNDE